MNSALTGAVVFACLFGAGLFSKVHFTNVGVTSSMGVVPKSMVPAAGVGELLLTPESPVPVTP